MVSFASLEVGKCYSCGDAEYMVLYITSNFAVVICYSHNHLSGTLEFWGREDPVLEWVEEVKECPLSEYIDDLVVVDKETIKNKK